MKAKIDARKARLCELQLNPPNIYITGTKVKAPSSDLTVQAVLEPDRGNYETLMAAKKRRYGSDNKSRWN